MNGPEEIMAENKKHKWAFQSRFRRNAYGWRSSKLAVQRIKEAISEIKKAARKESETAAEGAVLFLEKVSPAIEHVNSSSGALGGAVNKAIQTLIPIIAEAEVTDRNREKWLNRLWQAVENDDIPYLECLSDNWGTLCAVPEQASTWADTFLYTVKTMWSHEPIPGAYFKGTTACMSSLYVAGRYDELLDLLELAPYSYWYHHQWGVKALFAQGKRAEALRYAEKSTGSNDNPADIAVLCEEILLASGMQEEAYRRYAVQANWKTTYLATFRAITKKYSSLDPGGILDDLIAEVPGDEGKWFAAAKSAGLYNKAIELANHAPADPRTLTRAARDFVTSQPEFAVASGLAALRWIIAGYGYDITSGDVLDAYGRTIEAAIEIKKEHVVKVQISKMISGDTENSRFVSGILLRYLDTSSKKSSTEDE